jgi:hypothetical protein
MLCGLGLLLLRSALPRMTPVVVVTSSTGDGACQLVQNDGSLLKRFTRMTAKRSI